MKEVYENVYRRLSNISKEEMIPLYAVSDILDQELNCAIAKAKSYVEAIEKIFAKSTQSQSDEFAQGLHLCAALKEELSEEHNVAACKKEYISKILVEIQVYDKTTLEKIESIIDEALNENNIDCTFEVTESER